MPCRCVGGSDDDEQRAGANMILHCFRKYLLRGLLVGWYLSRIRFDSLMALVPWCCEFGVFSGGDLTGTLSGVEGG